MNRNSFPDVASLLQQWRPEQPVYCLYPHQIRQTGRDFVDGFPGRVLYAVKANDDPGVLLELRAGGVRHFDCASTAELERVHEVVDNPTCYLMVPVWPRGTARDAQNRFQTRHFLVDHPDGLSNLCSEIIPEGCVVFARMAVHHESAVMDLSAKFGAPPEQIPDLIQRIADAGAEPALAFNVGSSVTSPAAYAHAMATAKNVMESLPAPLRLVDIGGGFARPYPGFPVPPLTDYFTTVETQRTGLPLAANGELMAEPGRALAAPGVSAVVEVLLNKGDRIYINDGMYGVFWELRFDHHQRFPVRAYRDGEPLGGETRSYTVFGPTCDSADQLPASVDLPADLRAGDHLEFGQIGAYSLAGRTRFNGLYSDQIVTIDDPAARPPETKV